MDAKALISLNLIFCLICSCANSKKPTQLKQEPVSLEVLSSEVTNYFPGTGIGSGEHFKIILVNQSKNTIQLDSLQTKLHCISFDGNPIIESKDTLLVNAFGLTINYDLFPEMPIKPFKGDSSLNDGGTIYFTEAKENKTISIAKFKKGASSFYD